MLIPFYKWGKLSHRENLPKATKLISDRAFVKDKVGPSTKCRRDSLRSRKNQEEEECEEWGWQAA